MRQYVSLDEYMKSISKPKRREALACLLSGAVKSVAEIDDGLYSVLFHSDEQQWVEVTLSENSIQLEDSHCFICGSKDCTHSIAAC